MYYVHSKLIDMANKELDLPADVMVKLHGNVVFDLLITLPPILGTLLAWLNACSTRNCAISCGVASTEMFKVSYSSVFLTEDIFDGGEIY